jgi:retron-type reverse transcriptase
MPAPTPSEKRNHDSLMARVAMRVSDKRVPKLIRAFLNAGVMEDGLVRPVDEGTPQGGPLSPLLSNLVLDDLDKELTRRGHRGFVTLTNAGQEQAGATRVHAAVTAASHCAAASARKGHCHGNESRAEEWTGLAPL